MYKTRKHWEHRPSNQILFQWNENPWPSKNIRLIFMAAFGTSQCLMGGSPPCFSIFNWEPQFQFWVNCSCFGWTSFNKSMLFTFRCCCPNSLATVETAGADLALLRWVENPSVFPANCLYVLIINGHVPATGKLAEITFLGILKFTL